MQTIQYLNQVHNDYHLNMKKKNKMLREKLHVFIKIILKIIKTTNPLRVPLKTWKKKTTSFRPCMSSKSCFPRLLYFNFKDKVCVVWVQTGNVLAEDCRPRKSGINAKDSSCPKQLSLYL